MRSWHVVPPLAVQSVLEYVARPILEGDFDTLE